MYLFDQKEMNKITIDELKSMGYDTELTLQQDCFYCVFTDAIFPLNSFSVDQEFNVDINGKLTKVKAVSSKEFNLKGYCLV